MSHVTHHSFEGASVLSAPPRAHDPPGSHLLTAPITIRHSSFAIRQTSHHSSLITRHLSLPFAVVICPMARKRNPGLPGQSASSESEALDTLNAKARRKSDPRRLIEATI